jgi:hypothetical protein
VKHNAILILNASKLATWHFFVFARHAGVFRFNVGRSDHPGPRPPVKAEHARFSYEATPFLENGKHKQLVELRNDRFEYQLEAATLPRPHSLHGALTWRWICPHCGTRALELRLRLFEDAFRCESCLQVDRRAQRLNGSFLVLPPKLSANVVPFKAARSEVFV